MWMKKRWKRVLQVRSQQRKQLLAEAHRHLELLCVRESVGVGDARRAQDSLKLMGDLLLAKGQRWRGIRKAVKRLCTTLFAHLRVPAAGRSAFWGELEGSPQIPRRLLRSARKAEAATKSTTSGGGKGGKVASASEKALEKAEKKEEKETQKKKKKKKKKKRSEAASKKRWEKNNEKRDKKRAAGGRGGGRGGGTV